jgi:hypothetical protein
MAARARRWPWVVGIVAAALVGGLVVGIANGGSPSETDTAADQVTTSPSTSSAAIPVDESRPASGCLIGNPPSTPAFTELRASKDFTPAGAVEFLGAFFQLISYSSPNYPAGALDAGIAASAGEMQTHLVELQKSGLNAFGDDSLHAITLNGARYQVIEATTEQVRVAMFDWKIKDGVLATDESGMNIQGGGTYTVAPTDAGWQVTAIDNVDDIDALNSVGSEFVGGC